MLALNLLKLFSCQHQVQIAIIFAFQVSNQLLV